MGVYIPNMKMPEHCGVCRFAVDGWCYAYGKPNIDVLANDGRTNFCPLVPIPPHGELIDRDKLMKLDRMVGKLMMYGGEYVYTQAEINRAPTIIPADPGEEGKT